MRGLTQRPLLPPLPQRLVERRAGTIRDHMPKLGLQGSVLRARPRRQVSLLSTPNPDGG